MPARRLLAFILLNVFVSAAVVLAILFWWDSRQTEREITPLSSGVTPTRIISAENSALPESAQPTPQSDSEEAAESDIPSYTVQSGDTLGKISTEFDVAVADIMSMNEIDNPNFLQVGQVLIIPVDGIPTVTPLPTETPTPVLSPTPISFELPTDGEAVIQIGEIVGVGELEAEAVSIINSGTRPVSLLGWRLQDQDGRIYTFGQVTLFGEGAAILVHSSEGEEGPSDLYWAFDQAIWQPGETAILLDAEGTLRSTYKIGQG